ncbi:MAG: hypothetical protein IPK60_22775 [Sandaracinaceae bacterium]|nr:hypothetical protein [Sandaracinaceae bacterium]
MTTRAGRIAERIRKEFWDTRDNNPATRTPGAIASLMATVERIDFSDLLGPEVSADIAPILVMLAEELEKQARDGMELAEYERGQGFTELAMRLDASAENGKKVANFLRALERTAAA